jgi:hypothetical protein
MGGCYSGSYAYSSARTRAVRKKPSIPSWKINLKSFADFGDISSLVTAYKRFFNSRKSGGFFANVAQSLGVKNVADIPKEFPETEYEVKFNVVPYNGNSEEPSVIRYLNAFDFPVGPVARFLKDPVNTFAVGINHFIGDNRDEKLVVIEKGGALYLKEKGLVTPVKFGIPYEELVIKRTESRYKVNQNEAKERLKLVRQEQGVDYRGKIRKEKGDAFLLDTSDGRIYSMSFTRAHLTKPGDVGESAIQRQLELEYAGYLPGFRGFEKDSEKQIVRNMVDLAKYTSVMYGDSPIANGWRMNVSPTSERKYDFVSGKSVNCLKNQQSFQLPSKSLELALLN